MKRICPWLLMLALTMILTSCISFVPLPPASTDPSFTEEGSTLPSEGSSTEEPEVEVTPWLGADASATAFFEADGIVDRSKREYTYDEMAEDLALLAEMKKTAEIPVITKPAHGLELEGRAGEIFRLTAAGRGFYALASGGALSPDSDLRTGPYILK